MKELLFIYNPRAGQAQIKNQLHAIVDVFVKAGYRVTVHPTQDTGDARNVAAQFGGGFDRVVCAGGDGTLHEVVGGLMRLPNAPPLGYIPFGSTNDFGKNLHLPRTVTEKAVVAAGDHLISVDVGRFHRRSFIYVAAFGMFTEISYSTPQEFKNTFGHLAYLFAGVTSLASIKSQHMVVDYDDGRIEGDFIYGMVGNTVSVGGFQTLKETDMKLDDGLFEVLLLKMPETWAQWQGVLHQLRTQEPDESGAITVFRTKKVRFRTEQSISWTLDGEYGGDFDDVTVENLRHALRIAAGSERPLALPES